MVSKAIKFAERLYSIEAPLRKVVLPLPSFLKTDLCPSLLLKTSEAFMFPRAPCLLAKQCAKRNGRMGLMKIVTPLSR